jgi:hypothetical protein
MTIALVNIVKDPLDNDVTITLSISPVVIALNSMNFNNLITLTVGGARLIMTGSPITYTSSYDQAGTISIDVFYANNLEGQPVSLTLNYDQTKVALPAATLSFNMVGSNLPVLAADPSGLESKVYYVGYGIAGLYLLVMLLSLVFHKMIGL